MPLLNEDQHLELELGEKPSTTKRLSTAKRRTSPKKRGAIEEKEREVDEARKRLLQAEASLAAEEIPELTKKE